MIALYKAIFSPCVDLECRIEQHNQRFDGLNSTFTETVTAASRSVTYDPLINRSTHFIVDFLDVLRKSITQSSALFMLQMKY